MHIVVCAKRIPDPEPSAIPFKVDSEQLRRAQVPGLKMVISPYDEQCLEAARRIRDKLGDEVRITAICMGDEEDKKAFKEFFALGADEGVFLLDPGFVGADGFVTARILAAAIGKLAPVDLILTGRMAADFDEGVVGYALAELLDCPMLPCASMLEIEENIVTVQRVVEDGYDLIEADLPAVVSVSNELGEPRRPSMRQIMQAGRMKPTVWGADDLGLSVAQIGAQGALLEKLDLVVPQVQKSCEMIDGETPAILAEQLVSRLRSSRMVI